MDATQYLTLMGQKFDPSRHFFTPSDPGDWWDPSDLPLMYQDSAGTTAAAVNQPVGLMLGQRYKGQRGPELVTNGGFDSDTAWTKGAGWSIGGGVAANDGTGSFANLSQNVGLVAGTIYEVTFTVARTSGTVAVYAGISSVPFSTAASGTYTCRLRASGDSILYFQTFGVGGFFAGSIDNISVREVPGIHRYQTTAPNRPTLKQDANGNAEYNGTNSSLVAASGGGATSGFFLCTAVRPSAGAGTARTLWSDTGTNTGWRVRINASNQLELAGGNGTAYTTAATVGTLPVGETHVITCWHDGANLCAQIDGGAIATAALASVSAGTAGFTTGCDNGAASSYYAGKMWASIYRTGTPVTDSLRARAQRDIARRAGASL